MENILEKNCMKIKQKNASNPQYTIYIYIKVI